MDLNKIPLFDAVRKRLDWLSQRQEILAQNIANSDTPKYRPHDLKPFNFKSLVDRERMQLGVRVTSVNHITGKPQRLRNFNEVETRKPYESTPNGNAVILEEQMMKINETNISYKLTSDLYKKHTRMIQIALGRG